MERSLGLVSAVWLRASVLLSPSLKKSSERSGVGGSYFRSVGVFSSRSIFWYPGGGGWQEERIRG